MRRVGDDLYFNLDSHLENPEPIGQVRFESKSFWTMIHCTLQEEELIAYLKDEMSNDDRQLLIVVDERTTEESLWKRPQSENN